MTNGEIQVCMPNPMMSAVATKYLTQKKKRKLLGNYGSLLGVVVVVAIFMHLATTSFKFFGNEDNIISLFQE